MSKVKESEVDLNSDMSFEDWRHKYVHENTQSSSQSLSASNYGMVWLDIEENPSPGCSWSASSFESNCQYI